MHRSSPAALRPRRRLVGVLIGTPVALAVMSRGSAQQRVVRHVGVLSMGKPASDEVTRQVWAPMRELGWVEGRNLIVVRRYAGDDMTLLREFAEELVGTGVDAIATNGTPAAVAAKNATSRIPIVLFSAADPVRAGLVASLARPGGNVTGISSIAPEIDAKRMTLLRELLPAARRVGVLVDSKSGTARLRNPELEPLYAKLGLVPVFVDVASPDRLPAAVAELAKQRAEVLMLFNDGLLAVHGEAIVRMVYERRLPAVVDGDDLLEAGGIASYSTDDAEALRRAFTLLDKVLRGARPAELPIEQPTKFLLKINLKAAKALGVAVPQPILLRADAVIQ